MSSLSPEEINSKSEVSDSFKPPSSYNLLDGKNIIQYSNKENNSENQPKVDTSCNNSKNKSIFSVGSLNENTVSYQSETGETIKLDILERAILTIPEI